MWQQCWWRQWSLVGALVLAVTAPGFAVDGVIEITQARAKAGGVTPSDTPRFPVTLDHSGSYRLTGNLDVTDASARPSGVGAENTTAIQVTADNVTIDLNGFTIKGPSVCQTVGLCSTCTFTGSCLSLIGTTGVGIVSFNNTNIAVVNGTVQGMGADGICVIGSARIEGVSAIGNGGSGIFVLGQSLVAHSRALSNGSGGIGAEDSAVLGNTLACNRGLGLSLAAGGGYTGNVINNNNSNGHTAPQVSGGHEMPAG